MEHAQREDSVLYDLEVKEDVLILILMEHAQRGQGCSQIPHRGIVLILILMEHAQRGHFL